MIALKKSEWPRYLLDLTVVALIVMARLTWLGVPIERLLGPETSPKLALVISKR